MYIFNVLLFFQVSSDIYNPEWLPFAIPREISSNNFLDGKNTYDGCKKFHSISVSEGKSPLSSDSGGLHLFKLLAVESRDLSQAQKKVNVINPEQIHKIKSFSLKILRKNSCHSLNFFIFGNSYFLTFPACF